MGRGWYTSLPLALLVAAVPAQAKLDLAKTNPKTLSECRALVRRYPAEPAAYRCFGYVARRHRLNSEAIAELKAIVKREPHNAHALLALANLESTRGDRSAEAHYSAAAESFEQTRDYEQGIWTLTSLFFVHARRGEFVAASAALSRASAIASASGKQSLRLKVRYHEGLAAWYARDYGLAYSIYSEVEAQVFPGTDPPDTYLQTLVQNGLGQVAWALGRRRESYERFLRAAEIEHSTKDPVDEAGYRLNLAILAVERRENGEIDPSEVDKRLQEALQIAIDAPNPGAESKVRLLLAAQADRPSSERIDNATRALELARKLELIDKIGAALRQLAALGGQPPAPSYRRGKLLLDEARALAERSSNRRELYQTHLARAQWLERGGDRHAAISELQTAVDVAEQIRALQPEASTQAHVFAQYSSAYLRLAALLGSSGDDNGIARAFEVVERWRAGALLAALSAARVARPLPEDTPDRSARERVLDQIAEVQRGLVNQDLADGERNGMLTELRRLESEERLLRDRLARNDRRFRERTAPRVLSLQEIQAALAPGQALVSYCFPSVSDDGVALPGLAFVVSPQRSALVELSSQATVAHQVSLYLGLLRGREASEPSASVGLYQTLVEPVLKQLPDDVQQLVIVPDTPLHRLPLAALRSSGDGPPLIARYALSFAPSAATWALQATQSGHAQGSFLSLADPTLARAEASKPGATERSALFGSALALGQLHAARREARALASALRSGTSYTGEAASEYRLKTTDLSHCGVLHLAAHAVVDEVEPDRSAVLLAAGEQHEDGLLQPREIAALKLPGSLVMLSACQTATGEAIAGEGVLGLSRSFFEAGASSVVASLWPMRDEEAADLIASLSSGLSRGESVATALAGAERSALQRGQPAAAWAGFVVLGRGDIVPFPGGVPRPAWAVVFLPWLLAVGAIAVMVLIWLGWRRRPHYAD